MKSRRTFDVRGENAASDFLLKEFYTPKTHNYQKITTRDLQVKGIDSIFTLDSTEYKCDEKAAIWYSNRPYKLQTFAIELSFINRGGQENIGWFLDPKKENDSYLFLWIDKSKVDIIANADDVIEGEFALVTKDSIKKYLEDRGWNQETLLKKVAKIRANKDENLGDIKKNGCKFSFSPRLVEQPINILIPRNELIKMSTFNHKIS